jgi:hypothetical protein
MLASGVMLLHENACLHMSTSTRTRSLLGHFNWELFDHSPYSPDLVPSDYNLFTCLTDRLVSQPFKNNEELMEGVKTWLSPQAADCSRQAYKNLFPDTSVSILAVTTLRSSLSMYIFVYNNFFLISCFFNSSSVVTFRITLVSTGISVTTSL